MSIPSLRDRRGAGFHLAAWSSLASLPVQEILARSTFDAVTFDAQHGAHDLAGLHAGIGAAAAAGKPSIVRVPIDGAPFAARCLDLGASAVILPMVNGLADAQAFGAAMKYPPLGTRSYGPSRVVSLYGYPSGAAYFETANRDTLAYAMIETKGAYADLEAILSLDVIDGVFVGPSDLSLALSGGERLDPTGDVTESAVAAIAKAATAQGKSAAIYAITVDDARRYAGYGYDVVCVGSDTGIMTAGAAALAAAVRA